MEARLGLVVARLAAVERARGELGSPIAACAAELAVVVQRVALADDNAYARLCRLERARRLAAVYEASLSDDWTLASDDAAAASLVEAMHALDTLLDEARQRVLVAPSQNNDDVEDLIENSEHESTPRSLLHLDATLRPFFVGAHRGS